MNVFIFGVGRSGTTMLYSLCQSIYAHLYKVSYISTYEPYIWNPDLFNAPYEETRSLFGKTNSVSIEGIFSHLHTPMFVDNASLSEVLNTSLFSTLKDVFYHRFSEADENSTPHLVKFIRGNGRMHLFRYLNPKAKFILMVRNPIDLINSIKYKFSFFGEDFYPSDFQRFCMELRNKNLLTIDEKKATWAEIQAEYCVQMNRASINFGLGDSNTLILEYDNFNHDKPESVARLCDFLDISLDPAFIDKVVSPTGPTTTTITLSEGELSSIVSFDDLHTEVCNKAGIERTKPGSEVIRRYQGKCVNPDYDPGLDGLTTNPLRRMVRQKNNQIRELMQILARVRAGAS